MQPALVATRDNAHHREGDVAWWHRAEFARGLAVGGHPLDGLAEADLEDREVEGGRHVWRAQEDRVGDACDGDVVLEHAVDVFAHGDDPRPSGARPVEGAGDDRGELVLGLVEDGDEHALLAAEVVVEGWLGDAGQFSDFPDRSAGVALPVEDVHGGIEEAGAHALVELGGLREAASAFERGDSILALLMILTGRSMTTYR